MRFSALIGLALIAMAGMYEMAQPQASQPAIKVLDDGSAGGSIQLPLGRDVEIELGANPTTGYTWRLDANLHLLQLKSRQYRANAPPGASAPVGGGGVDQFVFGAKMPGTERLHFEYRRGPAGEPVRIYDLTVTVVP
jgi:predicted secreted protein